MDGVPASRTRILLGIYIDFLLFMVLWDYLQYFFAAEPLPFWVGLLAFTALKAVSFRFVGSPGAHMLGIDRSRRVDAALLRRESWLPLLLGLLFLIQGSKELVRWMNLDIARPFFGFVPGDAGQVAIHVTAGLACLVIGYLYLVQRPVAFWLALTASIAHIASMLLSWALWDDVVAEWVFNRRTLQGLPTRHEEIELFQRAMPEAPLVLTVILLIGIVVSYRQLARPARRSGLAADALNSTDPTAI